MGEGLGEDFLVGVDLEGLGEDFREGELELDDLELELDDLELELDDLELGLDVLVPAVFLPVLAIYLPFFFVSKLAIKRMNPSIKKTGNTIIYTQNKKKECEELIKLYLLLHRKLLRLLLRYCPQLLLPVLSKYYQLHNLLVKVGILVLYYLRSIMHLTV